MTARLGALLSRTVMLRLLGAIEASDGNSPLTTISTPRLRLVLAVLGAHAGQRVTVDRIADALWPDEVPKTAATALQGYISKVRRAFEPHLPPRTESAFVRTDADAYVLDLATDQFDIAHFTELARTGLDTDDENTLIEALRVWQGEPFAEFTDAPWALGHATELTQLRLRAAQRRYALAITAGRDGDIVDALRIDVEAHPFEERLAGLLMTALYRLGDQRGALDAFATTRNRLVEELGLDPTPDLRNLERLILQHDASLLEGMQIRPPIATVSSGGRPAMFGRGAELERLRDSFEQHRLVTLSGPGGVGKTRLAREFVDLRERALFVDLSASSTVADALGQLRTTLGVDGDPLTQTTTSIALAAEHSCDVLVLDNCEHLLPDLAAAVSELLNASASLCILATSRQNLGLGAEHTMRLDPLAAPTASMSLTELSQLPGMRILTSRSGQELDEHNAADLVDLHRRLDGVPLALELAAFRLRTIGIADVDPLLDDPSAPSPSDLPERHRSLERVLATSIDELDDSLREVLDWMSIFAGPIPLEAVVQLFRKHTDDIDVRIAVAELVNRSLVTMTTGPSGVRYGLLETVRSRCRRSLESTGAMRDLHVRHADVIRRAAASSVDSTRPQLGLDDLDDEVSAMLSRFERGDAEPHDHFGVLMPIATYWYGIGHVAEARRRLRSALDLYPDADPFLVATASALLGMISFGEGAFDDLASFTGTALDILSPLGFPGLDFVRAGHHVGRGDIAAARQAIETYLSDPTTTGRARLAGLEVATTTAFFEDDFEAAIGFFREQRELARREVDQYFEAHSLRGEAMMLAMTGQPEMGLDLARRADEVADRSRAERTQVEALATSAVIRDQFGDLDTAGNDAWETLGRCVRNFDAPAAALTVPIAAAHARCDGDADTVARLAGWFDALCRTTGLYASPASRRRLAGVIDEAQAGMEADRWRQLSADGMAAGLSGVLAARSIGP